MIPDTRTILFFREHATMGTKGGGETAAREVMVMVSASMRQRWESTA